MSVNSRCLLALLVSLTALAGCQAPPESSSRHGMVSTAHPLATLAATEVLEAGGNAVDAAVAAAFAIAVVEPSMNGLGGRNLILIRNPDGTFVAYNGMTEVPASYRRGEDPPASGYGTVAIPGVIAALGRMHAENGFLPWQDLLARAARYAHEGFVLLPGEASRHSNVQDRIAAQPGFTGTFTDSTGSTLAAGEILVQPALAETISEVADNGSQAFYQGEIADQIAADMAANGGFVTRQDLENYRALDGRVVTTRYRDFDVHSIAAPGGGGLVVKTLNILENFNLAELDDVVWATVMAQALALSIDSMAADYHEEDLSLVSDKSWAREQSRRIVVPAAISDRGGDNVDGPAVTDWAGAFWGNHSHHTTHFVVADCSGMSVSLTQTLGPSFGSKVMTPGLGVVYAATMGSYLSQSDQVPGSRPRTTIAPTVITRNGEIELVLGAAGGLRILSAIVQTISRYVDQGKSLQAALAAPRVHPQTGFNEETGKREVYLESFYAEATAGDGWKTGDVRAWQQAGFNVEATTRRAAFGRVHALQKKDGRYLGAADPDWEGVAAAPISSRCQIGAQP